MENVVLSVDGRRSTHDGVRKTVNGKGSYDVIIENKQAIEMTVIYRDIINGTRELMSSVLDNRLNNVMKTLTSITLIMAVPTVISGIYGMNVNSEGMPFASSALGFAVICVVVFGFGLCCFNVSICFLRVFISLLSVFICVCVFFSSSLVLFNF